ncbi:MAG: hypothetical protein PHR25_04075 [Clostridia bacterium]|nr:hypothetical protein [Clostridia bacterium]MDD4375940.1 hypothetical protein [Clostridia bacterium]
MKRSSISRSIIAVVFMIYIIGLLIIAFMNNQVDKTPMEYQLIYILSLLFAVFCYAILKKKLNNLNCKKSVEYSYRYIYLVMLLLITRFIAVLIYKGNANYELINPSFENGLGSYAIYLLGKVTLEPLYATIIINTTLTFVCIIVIKRLVFNITNNEMLSAIASILFIFIPQAIQNVINYTPLLFNNTFILLGVYLILKIIDEVKQPKLKTKKYIHLTVIVGIIIIVDVLLGGRFEGWMLLAIGTLLISYNIDYITVKVRREWIEKTTNIKIRRKLYKIEGLMISKLIIVITIIILMSLISLGIVYLLKQDVLEMYNISTHEVFNNTKNIFGDFNGYYISLIIITIIFDIIGLVLRRKRDTKTSLLKLTTIIAGTITILINKDYVACILDTMLIITLVLNAGNIYYNRDEKIKLLKEIN